MSSALTCETRSRREWRPAPHVQITLHIIHPSPQQLNPFPNSTSNGSVNLANRKLPSPLQSNPNPHPPFLSDSPTTQQHLGLHPPKLIPSVATVSLQTWLATPPTMPPLPSQPSTSQRSRKSLQPSSPPAPAPRHPKNLPHSCPNLHPHNSSSQPQLLLPSATARHHPTTCPLPTNPITPPQPPPTDL